MWSAALSIVAFDSYMFSRFTYAFPILDSYSIVFSVLQRESASVM
jgi:hypothetical protein